MEIHTEQSVEQGTTKFDNRTITIVLRPKTIFHVSKKMVYPLEEYLPGVPHFINANDRLMQNAIQRLAIDGIELISTEKKLVWIPASQIKRIELNF